MAVRKNQRKRQDRWVEDPDLGSVLELEPIDIQGSVSREVIDVPAIDIQGSRSADVEPFAFEDVPGAQVRREDGVSTMLPEWVPPWATEIVGQPVRGMGGSTEYEVPEWAAELVADSEGQMPTSLLGGAATMATNFIPGVAPYRMFTGTAPSADARTLSPLAAGAGLAEAGAMGFGDDIVGLFDDEAGAEYTQGMRDTQRQAPGSFSVGEGAAMLGQMLVPGANLGAGRGALARGLGGAAEGAAYGALEGVGRSDADTLSGRLEDALPGVALGAGLGGALGAGTGLAERWAAQPVDEAAIERALDSAAMERLGQSGGSQSLSSKRMRMLAPGATPREQMASARRTVDRMRDYGAFDGIIPPGPETIAQRVGAQRELAHADMDRIEDRMAGESISIQPILNHLEDAATRYGRIPGAEADAQGMRDLLDKFRARTTGTARDATGDVSVAGEMGMPDLQEWKTFYRRTSNPNSDALPAEDRRDIYRAITGNMQQGVADVDPVLGADYQRARHDEFIGAGFDEMIGHLEMDKARLRKIPLSDYMTGLAGFQNGLLPGLASIAVNRGIRRNEHGLNAMQLERTARRLRTAPERFGRWAERLQQAQARGKDAFSAALFIAAQEDASVREAMADDADEQQMREQGATQQQEREQMDALFTGDAQDTIPEDATDAELDAFFQ